ncbi:MAG: serine hydrolase domain-containing protein [Gemmatimonadaceae bacterium]
MADACDPLRVRLRALEAQLKDSQPVPGERHPPKPPSNLNGVIRQIAATRDELNACVESLMIRRWTVTGNMFPGALAIDRAIKRFMFDHDIRASSVAIAKRGTIVGTRAYTWAMADYPITRPETLFRVASVSKMFTCAAIDQLVATGALRFETLAFPYLGVFQLPLIPADRDINSITVKDLAIRVSGLQEDVEVDIRSIAKLFGTTSRPTRAQVLQYIFGTPLVSRPGTIDNYSNPAFTVLTAIVEKASNLSYIDYLRRAVLTPLGIVDVHVGATAAGLRRADEVATYDASGISPSHVDMADGATAPDAHGGTFALEEDVGDGGLIMSTATIARFLGTHAVWDIGPRQVTGRYGRFAGTGAMAVSLANGLDFGVGFNREIEYPDYNTLVAQIESILDVVVRRSETVDSVLSGLARDVLMVFDTIRDVVARRLGTCQRV